VAGERLFSRGGGAGARGDGADVPGVGGSGELAGGGAGIRGPGAGAGGADGRGEKSEQPESSTASATASSLDGWVRSVSE